MYTDSLNGSQGTKFKQHFWSVFFQFFSSFSWDKKSIRWNSHGTQKKQRRQRWRQHIVYIFILGALTSFILYLDILFHNFLVHSCFLPSLFLKSLSLSSAVAVEVAAAAIFLHFATKYVFLYVQCVRVCVWVAVFFFHFSRFSFEWVFEWRFIAFGSIKKRKESRTWKPERDVSYTSQKSISKWILQAEMKWRKTHIYENRIGDNVNSNNEKKTSVYYILSIDFS